MWQEGQVCVKSIIDPSLCRDGSPRLSIANMGLPTCLLLQSCICLQMQYMYIHDNYPSN